MNYFAGLDVSLKRTAICIVDQDGTIVREGVTDTEPEAPRGHAKCEALTKPMRGIMVCEVTPLSLARDLADGTENGLFTNGVLRTEYRTGVGTPR
jgi:hypothetical protein